LRKNSHQKKLLFGSIGQKKTKRKALNRSLLKLYPEKKIELLRKRGRIQENTLLLKFYNIEKIY